MDASETFFRRHRLFTFLTVGTLLLFTIVFSVTTYDASKKLNILKEENLNLRIKTENLSIFTEDKGRILKLEEVLLTQTSAKKNLGDRIPRFAVRALALCDKYKDDGLTVPTLMGIIETESDFNPKAISRALDGKTPVAYGLMQIVRSTATPILKDMGYGWDVNTMLIPETNMEVGVTYLISLHREFMALGLENVNEFHISLIAYNRGETVVLESVNARKHATISLDYLGRVKVVSRKWETAGF